MNAPAFFRRLVSPVVDFIYPPVCALCDDALAPGDRSICGRCWTSFRRVDPSHPVWQELFARLSEGGHVGGLASCYLFEKEGALQEAMHLIKYRGWKNVGERLGRDLGMALEASGTRAMVDIAVPVPLHRVKERERGFNQSAVLCRGISAVTGIPVEAKALARTRYTPSQTTLTASERRHNVAGAFAVRRRARATIAGRRCLLVDDVLTTGATVQACAGALKSAGAASVIVAAAALAQ